MDVWMCGCALADGDEMPSGAAGYLKFHRQARFFSFGEEMTWRPSLVDQNSVHGIFHAGIFSSSPTNPY